MTYTADDQSLDDSQPRDGFEFVLPSVTYRLTSGVRDVVINGQTYRAGVIQRGVAEVTTAAKEAALEIPMIITHALPQRYLQMGVPPGRIDVNVYSKQLTSGEFELVWIGRILSMRIEDHVATFLVPARTTDALQKRIPTISVGRECAHILYGSGCNLSSAAFTVTRTVALVDGSHVTLSSAPNVVDDWAKWGELIHTASGERRTISSQIGAVVDLSAPIPGMNSGDEVSVRAGCSHEIQTCSTKFNNQGNFGGMPHRPQANPFIPYDRPIWSLLRGV